jgi:hypothetical protein
LRAAPPELHGLAIAVMINEMAFIQPREACRPVFVERLAIFDSPRVRMSGSGCDFIATGEIKLAGGVRYRQGR